MAVICRAWITVKGERLYAKDYGLRAFCWDPGSSQEEALGKRFNKKNRPRLKATPPRRKRT